MALGEAAADQGAVADEHDHLHISPAQRSARREAGPEAGSHSPVTSHLFLGNVFSVCRKGKDVVLERSQQIPCKAKESWIGFLTVFNIVLIHMIYRTTSAGIREQK